MISKTLCLLKAQVWEFLDPFLFLEAEKKSNAQQGLPFPTLSPSHHPTIVFNCPFKMSAAGSC
jgi:hypothetical protein